MKTSTFIFMAVVFPVIFIGAFAILEMHHQRKHSRGVEIYKTEGCNNCHGADLKGTPAGPPLIKIKSAWNKNALIKFIKNPKSKIRRHAHMPKSDQNQVHQYLAPAHLTWKQTLSLTSYLLEEK